MMIFYDDDDDDGGDDDDSDAIIDDFLCVCVQSLFQPPSFEITEFFYVCEFLKLAGICDLSKVNEFDDELQPVRISRTHFHLSIFVVAAAAVVVVAAAAAAAAAAVVVAAVVIVVGCNSIFIGAVVIVAFIYLIAIVCRCGRGYHPNRCV